MRLLITLFSLAFAVASHGQKTLALDVSSGAGYNEVQVITGANTLLGFDAAGNPGRVIIGSGLALNTLVLTNTGGSGGGSGDALTSGTLAQFAATTSAQLRSVLTDESGTGAFLTVNGNGSALTGITHTQVSGLGTLATQSGTLSSYLLSATAASTYQPLDPDLTAITALATHAYGLALLTANDPEWTRMYLQLGGNDTVIFGQIQTGNIYGTFWGQTVLNGPEALGFDHMDAEFAGVRSHIYVEDGRDAGDYALPVAPSGRLLADTSDLAAAKITGTLPVNHGGTGATTAAAARVALLPSLTSNAGKFMRVNAAATDVEYATIGGGGDALTSGTLAQFAATTSAQLRGVLNDESGTGIMLTSNGDGSALTGITHTQVGGLGTLATQSATITNYLLSATAASTYQPLDSDLTSIAALSTTSHGRGLLDDADATASRTSLGLGTLATQSATITDYLLSATAASAYQPLDSDLTSIAALTTTSHGRGLLDDADASASRTSLGLGTLATQSATITDYLLSATAASTYQPLDSDLTSIAALTTTSHGRGLLDDADATASRTSLGLVIGTNVQAYDADLADLADGSLTGTLVAAATTSARGSVELATDGETAASVAVQGNDTRLVQAGRVEIGVAISDETTALTTGTAKLTFRMPHAMTVTAVRLSLTTVSSSGTPTIDINEAGSTILSTKLTCDASEKTSVTAASAPVISDATLADDAEITIDIDTAGTGAAGAKVWLIGTR